MAGGDSLSFNTLKIIFWMTFDVVVSTILSIPLMFIWAIELFNRKKKSVNGKLAVITGGANGLGRQVALNLASLGCNMAILDVDEKAAEKVLTEIEELGVKSKFYKVDVTKALEIVKARDAIHNDFKTIDILINNAGIISTRSLSVPSEHIERMVNVNLLGPILMTKYFLETMTKQKSGHIVSISSMAGLHPSPYIIQYTATKFGINGLMAALNEHLRLEKMSSHIKTTCVFPYYIKTRQEIVDFMNPSFRIQPLSINYAAREVVNGILREDTVTVIPKFFEALKLLSIFPLKVQQLFKDRVLREYELKNVNYF